MQKLYYKTIANPFVYEIPKIKGSRFFGSLFAIDNKQEAENIINDLCKKYHDATHNCYAYKFGVNLNYDLFGNPNITPESKKANDDGEPANTAGKPILAVLDGQNLQNILLVVTRYFGGTLLGVGGLIQAYTQTAKETIAHAQIIQKEITTTYKIQYTYQQLPLLQHIFSKYEVKILSDAYDTNIDQTIAINKGFAQDFKKELADKGLEKIFI